MDSTTPRADGAPHPRPRAAEEPGAEWRARDAALRAGVQALDEREAQLNRRESELVRQGARLDERAREQDAADTGWAESEEDNKTLRELNEHLVLLSLEAQALRDAAELARSRQDEFLAMLAHELRNPLGPIRNAAEVLSRLQDTPPTTRAFLDIIRRQVAHMVRLLDDLLDVARVTQGKVSLERKPTAVSGFIARALEVARESIDERRQQLTVDLPADPLFVHGDGVRLAQVFSNLLQNASKYTQPGGAIAVHAHRVAQAVVIRVTDNGIGIPAEMMARIFDLFTQDERTIDRSQGGLGIGLTVVRRMVELHDGTVHAHSGGSEGGSEFTVSLPLMAQEQQVDVASSATSSRVPAGARVLLIEDNVDAGEALAEYLDMSGHVVEVALDGRAGLDLFETFKPQVVLCDIGLPGMDGWEVASRICERRPTGRPTMVALTGYGSPQDHDRSLAAGFDHHLVKPADPQVLLRLIDAAVRLESLAHAGPAALPDAETREPLQSQRQR